MSAPWYVAFCKPRGEAVGEANLQRQGYATYLPRLVGERRRAGKWVACVEPLFPRYLFLQPRDAGHSLAPVRSTLGVCGLVRFGMQPAVVPAALIEELRAAEAEARAEGEGGHPAGARSHPRCRELFTPGATVKFMTGPFAGLAGIYGKASGADRAIVLLELLGRMQDVTVERDWIVPAAA